MKKPARANPLQFRLRLDVLSELDKRASRGGRTDAFERVVNRYVALMNAGRKSLAGVFKEDEARFLVTIYDGLLLDSDDALPLCDQVAQAVRASGLKPPENPAALVEKLKIDTTRAIALIDSIEVARGLEESGAAGFEKRAAKRLLRILERGI
ncbi:MAG: hypothetical protein ACREDR_35470 [Blastocatellia bacterium]